MDSRQYRIRFLKHFPAIFLLIASIFGSGCLPKEPDLNSNLEVNLPTQLDTRALSGNCADNLWADVLIDRQAAAKLQKTGGNWQGEIKLTPGPHALKIEFKCTTNNFGTVVLATYTEDINPSVNNNINLSSDNYQYPDNDQDGSSNLAEIKAGTDPGSPSNGFKWANPLPQGNTLNDVIWNGSEFLAVGIGGSILTSGNGETWSLAYSAASALLYSIAWSGAQYVIVGDQGRILSRSGNNFDWTIINSGTKKDLYDVIWTGDLFVAVGWGVALTSTDGIHWTTHAIPDAPLLRGITWTGDKLVAAGGTLNADTNRFEGGIVTSTDGTSWSAPQLTGTPSLLDITWTGSQLVAVGGDNYTTVGFRKGGIIITSTDGKNWVEQASGTDVDLYKVSNDTDSGLIIAVGGNSNLIFPDNPDNSVLLSSPDGINWTPKDSTQHEIHRGFASSASQSVVVGNAGIIKSSSNLRQWTNRISGTLNTILDMVSIGNQVVAVGENGEILTSIDGYSWASRNSGITANLHAITWTGSLLVAVGGEFGEIQDGVILSSSDGISWTNRTPTSSLGMITNVSWTGSQLVAVGANGLILTSPNGIDWTSRNSTTNNWLWAIDASSDLIVATGYYGTIIISSDGGISWTRIDGMDKNIDLFGTTWTGSSFLVAGGTFRSAEGPKEDTGIIFTSTDGMNWTAIDPGVNGVLYDIEWTGTKFLAVTGNSYLLTSSDANAWNVTRTISSNAHYSTIDHQGTTLISGGNGMILIGS